MPVYNSVKYVADALESALAQTMTDFEMIIIDDGSCDGTTDVLQRYAARDERIHLIIRENRGLIDTRNELLDLANGTYIAWMDSDDISLPARLECQLAAMKRDSDLVCVGGTVVLVDSDNLPLEVRRFPARLDIKKHLLSPWTELPFCASLMRTHAARTVGGFREPFKVGEDFDLLTRLIEIGSIGNVSEPIVRYRQHPASVSSPSGLGMQWLCYCKVILELAEERRTFGADRLQRGIPVTIPTSVSNQDQDPMNVAHARWARMALENGFRRTAFKHAIASFLANPCSPIGWKLLLRICLGR